MMLPSGPFSLIYADPPWQYRDKANAGKRGACHKYRVMTLDAICALPVAEIAARDCLLTMWWTGSMWAEATYLAAQWGFGVVTMTGFTWPEVTQTGKDHFGMGHYTQGMSKTFYLPSVGDSSARAPASAR